MATGRECQCVLRTTCFWTFDAPFSRTSYELSSFLFYFVFFRYVMFLLTYFFYFTLLKCRSFLFFLYLIFFRNVRLAYLSKKITRLSRVWIPRVTYDDDEMLKARTIASKKRVFFFFFSFLCFLLSHRWPNAFLLICQPNFLFLFLPLPPLRSF